MTLGSAAKQRGGFMLGHSQAGDRALLQAITTQLVAELQRRGAVPDYEGRTLREKLAG